MVNKNDPPKNGSDDKEDYEIGYCKPPTHTQFPPGQSGNPKGRPRGSKNKKNLVPAVWEDAFNSMILEEGYRPIQVRENGQETTMPAVQAIARRMAVDAVQGKPGAQKLFIPWFQGAENWRLKVHEDILKAAIDYKENCTRTLDEHRRAGKPPPEMYPHPDDLHFDERTGEVEIRGPKSQQDRADLDQLAQFLDGLDANIAMFEELRKENPDCDILKRDLHAARGKRDKIRGLLPHYFDDWRRRSRDR
jgi:hypothetical protein